MEVVEGAQADIWFGNGNLHDELLQLENAVLVGLGQHKIAKLGKVKIKVLT